MTTKRRGKRSRLIYLAGRMQEISLVSIDCGIPALTIHRRMVKGMSAEEATAKPLRTKQYNLRATPDVAEDLLLTEKQYCQRNTIVSCLRQSMPIAQIIARLRRADHASM